jgi:hypothetical protein
MRTNRGVSCTPVGLVAGLLAGLFVVLTPSFAGACACGCGVFEVGTSSMYQTHPGGMVFLEYDFLDQNQNWHSTSAAPAANNDDKRLRTHFFTLGLQYMFNRSWGVILDVPTADRLFKTTGDAGNIETFEHGALGDIRLQGIYSGFSPDMSTGITFGAKLPSGDYTYPNFDRDTEIGSGSTDFLLGAYHLDTLDLGRLAPGRTLGWFAQILWQHALLTQGGYRPGDELNTAAGITYDFGPLGKLTELAPVLELINSERWKDTGPAANTPNTGYSRILLAPGIETGVGNFRIFADLGLPLYVDMNGNQVVSRLFPKLVMSYMF